MAPTSRLFITTVLVKWAAGISLSVPTADVVQSTSIDCAWSATVVDPGSFSLAMQFDVNFTQIALVTTVRRGNETSGTVAKIPNVIHPGPHRLAAYADPFDDQFPPFSVSPTFQVVPNSTPSPASTSILMSTNEPPSMTNPRSISSTASASSRPTNSRSSNSKNSRAVLTIAVSVTCTALGLIFLGALTYFLVRWRRARVPPVLPVRNLSPFLARAPEMSGSSSSTGATSTRYPKRGDGESTLGDGAPPPYVPL